tara:strand:- start:1481 stop:1660 length:180 start_codon:yes stop_codon:yes gene_type:complete
MPPLVVEAVFDARVPVGKEPTAVSVVVVPGSKLAGGVRIISSEAVALPQPRNGVELDEL